MISQSYKDHVDKLSDFELFRMSRRINREDFGSHYKYVMARLSERTDEELESIPDYEDYSIKKLEAENLSVDEKEAPIRKALIKQTIIRKKEFAEKPVMEKEDTNFFPNKVFQRKAVEGEIISDFLYNFTMGLVLFWGFLVNWLMVKYIPTSQVERIDFLVFVFGYFGSCFLGVFIFNKSKNPFISFIGYNFVCVPFGFVINLVVSRYNPELVLEAVRITGIVTLIMMIWGSLYPDFFRKISDALTISLGVVIAVELFEIFVMGIHHGVIDWIVVIIFCGYIGYDWARANGIPKTYDNAVDSAAAIYMDIINLFLRILRILGRKR